jgi:dolichol kinase
MTDVKHKIVLFLKKSVRNRKIITNLSRKVFHLFVFLMFAYPTPLKIQLAEVLFVFLIVTSDSRHFRLIFKNFLSNNDKGRVITSHVYLLSAVLFPYYLLDSDEYKLNVISICIFDSLCSLIGTAMKKKTKSIEGTAFGLIFTLLFTKIFYRYIDVLYFIFIAIVEQITFINDNISIQFFTVVYFSLKKRFNF